MMNILLIGGNGFIGSHLVDHFLLHGHYVRIFDARQEQFRKPLPGVDYRISELDHVSDLDEAMSGMDLVVHLASSSVPSTSNADMVTDIQKNLLASIQIMDLMVRHGIKKLVFLSSGGAVYGPSQHSLLDESHALNPISSYGILKVSIEHYIKLYHRQFGLDYLILRPSNPYGPRQGHFNAQGVISTFLRKAMKKEPLYIFGDGKTEKDYIYIDDLTAVLGSLIAKNTSGIYNIGSGMGSSLLEIIRHIQAVTQMDLAVNYSDAKAYDVPNFILNNQKTMRCLDGDFAFTSLERGIVKTFDWLISMKYENASKPLPSRI